jgi:hypothetical protein
MSSYRIKTIGSSFVISADGHDVLRCADEKIARQIVRDAELGQFRGNSCASLTGAWTAGRGRTLPNV